MCAAVLGWSWRLQLDGCLVLGSGRERVLFVARLPVMSHNTIGVVVCMVGVGQALGLLVPVGWTLLL